MLGVIAGVLGLIVGVAGVQLARPVPPPTVASALPAAYTIPGSEPVLPWPAAGQASVEVLGIGDLGDSGAQAPRPIASVAKIMTAYVILADHPLQPGQEGPSLTVTAADVADYLADARVNNSAVRVIAGERLSERDALEALLVPSADNVARMLATWDAGSIPAFLAKMNATAAALGMHDTRYTDPSGLEPTTVSTARDQLKLAEKAIAVPIMAEITAMKKVTLPVAGTMANYNTMLGTAGIVGIKTGSTVAAGGCLVFAARHTVAGQTYTILGAVLGQGVGGPFVEVLPKVLSASRKLVDAAGAALRVYPIVHSGQVVANVRVPLGTGTAVLAAADVSLVGWPGLTYQLTTKIQAPRQGVAGGTVVGLVRATGSGVAASTAALTRDRIVTPGLMARLTRR